MSCQPCKPCKAVFTATYNKEWEDRTEIKKEKTFPKYDDAEEWGLMMVEKHKGADEQNLNIYDL